MPLSLKAYQDEGRKARGAILAVCGLCSCSHHSMCLGGRDVGAGFAECVALETGKAIYSVLKS